MKATPVEFESVCIFDDNSTRVRELAVDTGLTLVDQLPSRSNPGFTLLWLDNKLTLRDHRLKTPLDISVDFTAGKSLHRLKFGGGHGQPLARAVKSHTTPTICDATAGFGKDAFVFASLGCTVVLLEKSAIAHALLADALQRAKAHDATQAIADRMTLIHSDSTQLPATWPHTCPPDVVYLDPMYPEGKRQAKKEIQTLRVLLEAEQNESALLKAARLTGDRIVVKRPKAAVPLANVTPSGSIRSPNTRYDIYASLKE